MKKYIKILIPLSTTLIPISVVGCSSNINTFPQSWLDIDEETNTLNGFDQNHQRAYQLEDYSVLVIPKDVKYLKKQSFSVTTDPEYDAPNAIKVVAFEKDCQCERFTNEPREMKSTNFNLCENLETVIFPPKYNNIKDQYLFAGCPKLSVLDLSHIEADIHSERAIQFWLSYASMPNTGTIIQGKNQVFAQAVCKYLSDVGKTWIIK